MVIVTLNTGEEIELDCSMQDFETARRNSQRGSVRQGVFRGHVGNTFMIAGVEIDNRNIQGWREES